ncbi:MAG: PilN domain-containing protein [Gammaproteobacteria bacterium]|nr:PilN domain-containing protein [Gammaproteobacteria bacterium]
MQQINLYQAVFRNDPKPFSALIMLYSAVAAILIFSAISVYMINSQQQLRASHQLAKQRFEHSEQRLRQATLEYPPKARDKILQNELNSSRALLMQRRDLIAAFSGAAREQQPGFAHHLTALARQDIDKLWLTEISVTQEGKSLNLHGATLDAVLVPTYIEQLGNETIFKGSRFADLTIYRDTATATPLYRFSVSTPLPEVTPESPL